ncbi:MAG: hypothetical protein U9N33_00470 [Campylobacterota bacterium]|nr:hypothetical protein [Campylobacterota bacterium]
MSQVYHSNAKLNKHSRERVQHSSLNNIELSDMHGVNVKTIATLWVTLRAKGSGSLGVR